MMSFTGLQTTPPLQFYHIKHKQPLLRPSLYSLPKTLFSRKYVGLASTIPKDFHSTLEFTFKGPWNELSSLQNVWYKCIDFHHSFYLKLCSMTQWSINLASFNSKKKKNTTGWHCQVLLIAWDVAWLCSLDDSYKMPWPWKTLPRAFAFVEQGAP